MEALDQFYRTQVSLMVLPSAIERQLNLLEWILQNDRPEHLKQLQEVVTEIRSIIGRERVEYEPLRPAKKGRKKGEGRLGPMRRVLAVTQGFLDWEERFRLYETLECGHRHKPSMAMNAGAYARRECRKCYRGSPREVAEEDMPKEKQ